MVVGILATLAGLALLTYAADHFVAGAAELAVGLRVPTVVIGALVIGFGTSAPEMLVSSLAAGQGERDIGVGNIVGSNVANLTLVLGGGALLCRVTIASRLVRREIPLMAAAVALFALLSIGGFSRLDGIVLVAGLAATLGYLLRATKRERDSELAREVEELLGEHEPPGPRMAALRTVGGLIGTVAGAQLLVTGAVRLADRLGLSEAFVGLTIVAVGTSLPELVTAISAARRAEHDLIVGNVLGSNVFNSLAVGGAVALVGPGAIADRSLAVGGVVLMVVVTGLVALMMAARRRVSRVEAGAILAVYAVTVPFLA